MLTYSCTPYNCFIRFYFWVCYAYIIGKLYISMCSSLIIFSIFIYAFFYFNGINRSTQLCVHTCLYENYYLLRTAQTEERIFFLFHSKKIRKRDSYLKKTILPMLFNGNCTIKIENR